MLVLCWPDKEPPKIRCPPDVLTVVGARNAKSKTGVTMPDAAATDNVKVVKIQTDKSDRTVFQLGTTTVTYRAEDEAGNAGSCTMKVHVIGNATMAPSRKPSANDSRN